MTDEKISQLPTGTSIFGNDIFPFTHGITGAVAPETQQGTFLLLAQSQPFAGRYQPSGSAAAAATTPGTVLLDAGTLASSTGTIVIPVAQTHRSLELEISARTDRAAGADPIIYKLNSDTGSKYWAFIVWHNFDSQSNDEMAAQTSPSAIAYATANTAPTSEFGSYIVNISFYRQGKRKFFQSRGGQVVGTGTSQTFIYDGVGTVNLLDAITRIDLTPANGPNFVSGTSWALYGRA